MNDALIKKLQEIVGVKDVICDHEKLLNYSHDEFPLPAIRRVPEIAIRPHNADEVSRVLKLANEEKVPVTPRGGGTGLCGGCVPVRGGIVLLFEHMNKLLEVDKDNLMVTAEPGVILRDLFARIEQEGLFFPPHPGDETATVGGVIATNAGGARAIKYGTIRNFVRGLEVVLADGEIISVGGKIIKTSTGLSLLNLFIGSEGTLGIITKATISILPSPAQTSTLVIPYDTIRDAINTVPEIMKGKVSPLAIEFIEEDAIQVTEKYLGRDWPVKGARAYLVVIVDAGSPEEIDAVSEKIGRICLANKARDVLVADTPAKQKEILDFRSQMYEALKPNMLEDLDIVVPISEIAAHVEAVHEIEREHGLWLPTYGHAGDGNVHTHIMKFGFKEGKPDYTIRKDWEAVYKNVRSLIHEDAKRRGGLISGEHGIGLVKRGYMDAFLGKTQMDLMKGIKAVFDPNGILNPGKIF